MRVMSGLLQGFKKSQDRLRDIKAARDTKRRNDELFELKKKNINSQIEYRKKENPGDPAISQIEEAILDQFKLRDAKSKVEDNQIEGALNKTQKGMEAIKRTGQKVMRSAPRNDLPFDYSMNINPSTGNRSISLRPKKPLTEEAKRKQRREGLTLPTQKVIGDIETLVKETDVKDVTSSINELKDRLFEVFENEEEAINAGVDVDAIYSEFGMTREEVKKAFESQDEGEKEGFFKKAISSFWGK